MKPLIIIGISDAIEVAEMLHMQNQAAIMFPKYDFLFIRGATGVTTVVANAPSTAVEYYKTTPIVDWGL